MPNIELVDSLPLLMMSSQLYCGMWNFGMELGRSSRLPNLFKWTILVTVNHMIHHLQVVCLLSYTVQESCSNSASKMVTMLASGPMHALYSTVVSMQWIQISTHLHFFYIPCAANLPYLQSPMVAHFNLWSNLH